MNYFWLLFVSVFVLNVLNLLYKVWKKYLSDPNNNNNNNNDQSDMVPVLPVDSPVNLTTGHTTINTAMTPVLPRDRHDGNNNNNNNEGNLSLSLDDRIELYNKAFDSNGNQLALKDKHIIVKKKQKKETRKKKREKENEGEEEKETSDIELGDGDGDDDNDPQIYLSVESDHVLKVVGDTICSRRGLISCNSINGSTSSLCIDVKKEKETVSGTCVICLVEYMKDDIIVLSKDVSCRHVYHKECMVNYLATTAQEKANRPLAVIDNPCPVCRRPDYCTVCDGDVAQILSQKQQ